MIRRLAIPLLLVSVAGAFYLPQLDDVPYYFGRDEMFFGLSGYSLATTGRDGNGLLLPLYIQSPMRYGSEMWFQPLLMYSTAAMVALFGLDEASVRAPMALLGVVDVVLLYYIGRLIFRRQLLAVCAALLLAFSPAHLIHARVGMDFEAPLPFMLGWLLFILRYFEHGRRRDLIFAAIMLGTGLYTYIAAYMIMPMLGVFTVAMLWHRQEPLGTIGRFVLACLAPALASVAFLVTHPTVIADVMWHYARSEPHGLGAADLFTRYFDAQRFVNAARVYASFWEPRFLFILGPGRAAWQTGVLLVPLAGAMLCGFVETLRRPTPARVLVLGGLLLAPVPASLAGDPEAIQRAAGVVPFAVLLATVGIEAIWSSRSKAGSAAWFVACWGVPMVMANHFHPFLPHAQSLIRSMTAPVALAALAALWSAVPNWTLPSRTALIGAIVTTVALQAGYHLLGFDAIFWLSAACAVVIWSRWLRSGRTAAPGSVEEAAALTLLAAACSHLTFANSDYTSLGPIGGVPASLLALLAGTAASLSALTVVVLARRASTMMTGWQAATLPAVAAAGVIVTQLLYAELGYLADHRLRVLLSIVVIAGAIVTSVAARLVGTVQGLLGPLTALALLGTATYQFSFVQHDYFTRPGDLSEPFESDGYTRLAFETVIQRTEGRLPPAVHLAGVGSLGFADLYWQFYAHKYRREDLLSRTSSVAKLDAQEIRQLPRGSIVVTNQSSEQDQTIRDLADAGVVVNKVMLTAPDGRTRFWVLETDRGVQQ